MSKTQDKVAFELIFSSIFGVRFINHYGVESGAPPLDVYLDIDLDLQKVTDKLFLIFQDDKIYVTSGGLSFVDIIYVGDFNRQKQENFFLEFDIDYIKPDRISTKYTYDVLSIDSIPENLLGQLNVIRDSLIVDPAELEEELLQTGYASKIDVNKRLFYETVYEDGTICPVNNQPRLTRVHFYCDQYRNEKDQAMAVIDISEPEYCEYLFKVATRFMCAAGTQFARASDKLHDNGSVGGQQTRPALELDLLQHTIKKHLQCKVASEF